MRDWPPTSILPMSFFARPTLEVARDLLGCILWILDPRGALSGKIVEVEAYHQFEDPASHSAMGPRPRNASMFGEPGRLYVYRIYGIHDCVNIVTEPQGIGAAILIRALEPLTGLTVMRERRSRPDGPLERIRDLTSGPGRLAQAMGIDRSDDGRPLDGNRVAVCAGNPVPDTEVCTTPRIGVSRGREHPWRFCVQGNPFVSRSIPTTIPIHSH